MRPFLSDNVTSTDKMTLIDKEKIIEVEYNTSKVSNRKLFSNIISNLNNAEYSNFEPLANNISDRVLKYVLKYRKHPSIFAIDVCNKYPRLPFCFSEINREEILREILKLETSKAFQDNDILTNNIKENATTFATVLLLSFNDSVKKSNFPSCLKNGF